MPAAPSGCHTVAGPLEIWVDTGASHAMEHLGWSANGVSIEEVDFTQPLVSDEFGGDAGVPADYQHFGVQHRVTIELAKPVVATVDKVSKRYNQANTSSGSVGVGMLLGCANATFRLLLKSTTGAFVRNYVKAFPIGPIDWSPIGAQATRVRLTFLCNPDSTGVIYNALTTGT